MSHSDEYNSNEWDFCAPLREMIESDRAVGRTGKVFQPLGALSTLGNLRVLRALMLERKPERTLEVGMAFGGSALVVAASHRELGRSPKRQHLAIDPFQSTFWDGVGLSRLEDANLSDYIDLVERPSFVSLPELLSDHQESIQFAYIDGSHLFEDVFIDCYYTLRLMAPDGVMLVDDSTHPDVQKVLQFIQQHLGHLLEPVDLTAWRNTPRESRWKSLGRRLLGRYQLTAFRKVRSLTSYELRPWNSPLKKF